jgi:hypothetical protein
MAIKIKFIQQDSTNFVPRVIYNDITKTVSKKANLPKGGDAKPRVYSGHQFRHDSRVAEISLNRLTGALR